MLRQPGDARGKLNRDKEADSPGAQEQERDHLERGSSEDQNDDYNIDLGSCDGKKEGAEDTACQRDEDHDEGRDSVGGQYSREPFNKT